MAANLEDLVAPGLLKDLVKTASDESGLRFTVLDANGSPCAQPDLSQWFCGQMRRLCPACGGKCQDSDRELVGQLVQSNVPSVHECWLGLIEIAAPIIVREEVVGVMMVGGTGYPGLTAQEVVKRIRPCEPPDGEIARAFDDTVRSFDESQREALLAFVKALAKLIEQLATAQLQAREKEELSLKAATELRHLLDLATVLGQQRKLDDVIQKAVDGAITGMSAKRGGLTLYDSDRNMLVIKEYQPQEVWKRSGMTELPASRGESLSGEVYQTQEPLVCPDIQTHAFAKPLVPDSHGIALVPLTGRERLGVMWVESEDIGALTKADAGRLKLYAALSATAIENAQTLQQRDQFMELMTHQIVAPLNAVRGIAGRLSERLAGKVNSIEDRLARRIFSHLGITVNIVLKSANVFRLLRGEEPELDFKSERLSQIVMGQVDLYRPLAADKKIQIEVSQSELAGLPSVDMDRELMRQVFSVLLDNAIKYSLRQSEITVSVAMCDPLTAEVAVTNLGLPIRDADRERIFEFEYRTTEAKAAVPVGTGIGLAMAARIVTLHSGRMEVEVQPQQKGSLNRFEVQLPVRHT